MVKFIVCVTYLYGKSILMLLGTAETQVIHAIIQLFFSCTVNMYLSLCRPSYGDPVHRASLCPGGRESHLHLPGHCQPSHHGLQVGMKFYQNLTLNRYLKTLYYLSNKQYVSTHLLTALLQLYVHIRM